MFWGLIVKPEKRYVFIQNAPNRRKHASSFVFVFFLRYEQTVQASFHVSMACVEPNSLKDGATSLYLEVDNEDYLIGNLNKGNLNVTMDLNFTEGEDICFKTEVGTFFITFTSSPTNLVDMETWA